VADPVLGDAAIVALTAAGWRVAGQRAGAYVRLLPPGSPESVLIPLDPDAPDYASAMAVAVARLREMAVWGQAAFTVLEAARPGTSPGDAFAVARLAVERARLLAVAARAVRIDGADPAAQFGTGLLEVLSVVNRWQGLMLADAGDVRVMAVGDAAEEILNAILAGFGPGVKGDGRG
jgi:hypothetical protein